MSQGSNHKAQEEVFFCPRTGNLIMSLFPNALRHLSDALYSVQCHALSLYNVTQWIGTMNWDCIAWYDWYCTVLSFLLLHLYCNGSAI